MIWGQLSEAGAGVLAWLPLHPMREDIRLFPRHALVWLLDTTTTFQSSTHVLHVGEGEGSLCGSWPGPAPPLLWQPGSGLAVTARCMLSWGIPPLHSCLGNGNATSALPGFFLWEGQMGSTPGKAGRVTASTQVVQSVAAPVLPTPSPVPYLGLNVQNSNFVLLVDLVHCFKLGAKHVSLVASKLQKLIG